MTDLQDLPIKVATKEKQQQIISLVDQIIAIKNQNSQEDVTKLEHEIDILVYDLYGLTKEERLIVSPDTPTIS